MCVNAEPPLTPSASTRHTLGMETPNDNANSNAHEFTVSELSQSVKRAVEDEFGYVRVRGEVGRISRPGSGHVYFDLKDDKSVLAAVAWKGVASKWRFQPEQGLEVIATGKLTTFPGQSKYQIIVENVEPAGVGALMALLEERRKKLTAEGLFDPERKQELPYLPRVIGVVTSPSGAVIRDILHRLDDRFPTHVIVWPVRVQGESCAPEVARAVEGFNMLPPDGSITRPDLLIVARGGGSVEDLWGFNEEIVVRAISESEIPIISAIGHETDMTLADFAADKRAPTPTGAAEMAVPVRSELIGYVQDLGGRQSTGMRNFIRSRQDRLRAASAGLPRPAEMVGEARQRLDLASTRLAAGLSAARQAKALRLANLAPRLNAHSMSKRLADYGLRVSGLNRMATVALSGKAQRAKLTLEPTAARLSPAFTRGLEDRRRALGQLWKLANSLGYKNVLERGFSLVSDSNGNLVKNAGTLSNGDLLNLRFSTGEAQALVTDPSISDKDPRPAKRSPKAAGKDKDDGQESLF